MYLVILVSYLLGSIPFGLILTYLFGYGDIRKIGSGNIGVTNVLRTGNKFLALLTLIFDIGKGAIAAGLAYFIFRNSEGFITIPLQTESFDHTSFIYERDFYALLAGISAVIGHIFPIWLKFKGGKGVATYFGSILALSPMTGGCTICTWLITAFTFRYSSLAALVAVTLTPFYAYFITDSLFYAIAFALVSLLIIIKHHENIKRLVKGNESKISLSKNKMHIKTN